MTYKFNIIKTVFVVCSQEGIVATDLTRFSRVIDKLAAAIPASLFRPAIVILHALLDAREHLGFCLLDRDGLAQLAKLAPEYEGQQTAYIPPRIWSYQLTRLRQCLQDYTENQSRVEDCFQFCLDSYTQNYGSLQKAVNSKTDAGRSPFQNKPSRPIIKYHGSFKHTADRFGLTDLIERWLQPFTKEKGEHQIGMFSRYLDLVSRAGLAYLQNFSLMRIEEGMKLRSDCLLIEEDEKFGLIYLLCGETTKTDFDSDARWPACSSVTLALDGMKHIAALRMRCACKRDGIGLVPEDVANPYLISRQYEPWSRGKSGPYRNRPLEWTYARIQVAYPLLLDPSQLTVDAHDLKTARLITPDLDPESFKIGIPWNLAWHQLRRTGAVNMLASEMVDESSLQLLLKHRARVMTLYYGRNHSRLKLCDETRALFLTTMYQQIARDLRNLCSPRFVSPLGLGRKEAIVNFVRESDADSLERAARQGEVGVRRIRLGFCMNHVPCPYGGIESISHCLGGDGGKGCPELLADIDKEADIKIYEQVVDKQLSVVHPDSPRHRSLQGDKRAIGRFYELVQTQNG